MDLRSRHAALVPLLVVVAVATAAMMWRPRTRAAAPEPIAAAATQPAVTAAAPRSAARMLAEDPLHALLSEPERTGAERERFLAGVARAHAAEARDPAWGPAAEMALQAVASSPAMATTGLAPERWSSDCRSRTCRITAEFADRDAAQDWANFFLTGSGGTLAQAELSLQRTSDHATRVLIFGARP